MHGLQGPLSTDSNGRWFDPTSPLHVRGREGQPRVAWEPGSEGRGREQRALRLQPLTLHKGWGLCPATCTSPLTSTTAGRALTSPAALRRAAPAAGTGLPRGELPRVR